jgi:hypothetical protein
MRPAARAPEHRRHRKTSELSTASTEPRLPTSSARSRVRKPGPQPRSSSRSPAVKPAASKTLFVSRRHTSYWCPRREISFRSTERRTYSSFAIQTRGSCPRTLHRCWPNPSERCTCGSHLRRINELVLPPSSTLSNHIPVTHNQPKEASRRHPHQTENRSRRCEMKWGWYRDGHQVPRGAR